MNNYNPEGILSRPYENKEYISSPEMLEKAKEAGIILQAPVTLCDGAMNLHIALGGRLHGIIPYEEALFLKDGEVMKDIAILSRVGKTVSFKVIGKKEEAGALLFILSRKEAQRECYENKISALKAGDIIPAKITHLESFGAFADIGCGLISLLSIDAISVSRISHPRMRFSPGDEIKVVVKSRDEWGRIFISRKELLGTWEENASLFAPGQTVLGIVRSIEPYGVFVELTPNLTGLAEIKNGVKENTAVAVYIKSILKEKMKIKLVMIDEGSTLLPKITLPAFPSTAGKTHLDRWLYSPKGANKHIESIFS